jgi:hypothetical protein
MSSNSVRTTFNLATIKFYINTILEYIKDKDNAFESELYIMETYPDFYQEYPFLVKKLCKKDNLSTLYKMLGLLYNIEKGDETLGNVETNLGQELAQEYLYPNIKKN